MKRIVLWLGCLAMVASGAQANELFRWVDMQGKVHYGDVPPADATEVTSIKAPAAPIPNEDLPYETRRAQQNFPVVLYVTDNCAEYCDQARILLNKRGIPFSEKKLVTQGEFDAFKALSGFDGTPTLAVGKNFLKGFLAERWHAELDIAGYPRIAPYRPSGMLPASAPAATSQLPADPVAQ